MLLIAVHCTTNNFDRVPRTFRCLAECEECTFYTFSLIWSVDRTIPQWKSMLFRALSGRDRIGKCSKLGEREKGSERTSFLYTCRRRHKECWLVAFCLGCLASLWSESIINLLKLGKLWVWAFCLKLLIFPDFVEMWKFFVGFSNNLPLSYQMSTDVTVFPFVEMPPKISGCFWPFLIGGSRTEIINFSL